MSSDRGNESERLAACLSREVVPASGCTEPGSVALAVARAREALGEVSSVDSVHVRVSDCVFKNGRDVGIPGVRGARGNETAAALAAFGGRSIDGLQVLGSVGPAAVAEALAWLKAGRVRIERAAEQVGVYVEAHVVAQGCEAAAIIRGDHRNVSQVFVDGVSVDSSSCEARDDLEDPFTSSLAEIYELCDEIAMRDEDRLLDGVKMNLAVLEAALAASCDEVLVLTHALVGLQKRGRVQRDDLGYRIRIACVAASEYRMSGGTLPVMSSSGSGNAGIVTILPVALAADSIGASRSKTASALAVSHLTNSYVKSRIGRLAPICGCVVAAGSGAAAALCKLHGADATVATEAIRMLLSSTAGMFCDGAKQSCALKIGTAAHEAYVAALMAMSGARIIGAQGLADVTVDGTIDNVAWINDKGLHGLDRVIISLLERRQPDGAFEPVLKEPQ